MGQCLKKNYVHDLKKFFIVEQKKLDEAFEKISSSISKDNPISDNIIDKNTSLKFFWKND